MKPRLLLVSRKWPPAIGGMETYSVELAAGLDARFDVHRLVLPGRDDGHPPSLPAYAIFVLKAMLFCLLRGRRFPHVVFCDLVLFPAALCHWLVARRQRRLVIVYGLDLVYQTRRGLLPAAYRMFFAAFRATQGIFDGVVAISRYTAELARAGGLRRVAVVAPSLPDNELTRDESSPRALPDTWRDATRRVLYFGRLVPRKGALWFAQSVMPKLDPSVHFFVVGQSHDIAYREALQQGLRTHCLGRQASATLAGMIRDADVVVMPNIPTPAARDVEGFGLAAIEASALGGRLLAAAIDGVTDAVIDTQTGLLLPAGDADAWAQAIAQVLRGESLRDRERIAATTRDTYSRRRQASAFEHLLLDPDARA